jgi:hypothetical protein
MRMREVQVDLLRLRRKVIDTGGHGLLVTAVGRG